MIGGRKAVSLVARREILTRGRERSFPISTLVTIAVIAAIIFLPSVFGGGPDKATIAGAGAASGPVIQAAVALGDQFDIQLKALNAGDDARAERLVRAGDADIALVQDGGRLIVGADAPDEAVRAVQMASASGRALTQLQQTGVATDEARKMLDPPPLPATDLREDDRDQRTGFAFVVLLLLYGQILAYGITIAMGVVEEKSSRIVEILLAAIQPRELLAGKILGIGALGFIQLLIIGAAGLVMAGLSDQIKIGAAELGILPLMLVWFVLGFALYACAYAMAGALVSRQEDIQSVTGPLTMAIMAAFFLSFQAMSNPDGPLATVVSILPFLSPMVMPVRMIEGGVPAWQVVLSVVLCLAAITASVVLAGRMYGRAVLQTGGRVSLRRALSADS